MASQPTEEEKAKDRKFMDLYSRQIGTFGMEAMVKLLSVRVLIVGCNGVGAEAAKNLALAGVNKITLVDNEQPQQRDLGVNFCFNESHLSSGQTRAQLTQRLIAELNGFVKVAVASELNEALVGDHDIMIVTSGAANLSRQDLTRWNNFCRTRRGAADVPKPISFILTLQGGVLGSVFVDHGDQFVIKDLDGRPPLQKAIEEVKELTDKKGKRYSRIRFSTPEGMTPGSIGDYPEVRLAEVNGLNGATPIDTVVLRGMIGRNDPRDTVRIYPSLEEQGYSPYLGGGFLHQVKTPEVRNFRSLEEALDKPGEFVMVSPFMDFTLESTVHLTVLSLLEFANQNGGAFPALHDAAAADKLVAIAKDINAAGAKRKAEAPAPPAPESKPEDPDDESPAVFPPPPPPTDFSVDNVDEDFIRNAALLIRAELQPLSAFYGAVVAQEVVKMTGKYNPISQFFNSHWAEVLPEGAQFATDANFKPQGNRYDNLVAIFGQKFVEKLNSLNLFMVGCGALGCENIKNFALCGICCGSGKLVVTDNDRIEVSNLNRQFLFREDNVGQAKSAAAQQRASAMNPGIKVDARQDFVAPTTEHIFDDSFWMGLDAIVNALDNMKARLYVDNQCVLFEKPLVEAGTMGTAGNVDIVVPNKTTTYSDGGAADETGGIPMCTLRNFPYIFDHCIEWARALFDDLFVSPMQLTQQLLEDPAGFVARQKRDISSKAEGNSGLKRSLSEKAIKSLQQLRTTVNTLATNPTIETCMQLAFDQFVALFSHRIKSLVMNFPKGCKKSNGEEFWSGHRKFPTIIEAADRAALFEKFPDAADFLIAAGNLYACMLGLHPEKHQPKDNDPNNRWMAQYREKAWAQPIVNTLNEPAFKAEAVEGLDDDLKTAVSKDAQPEEQTDEQVDAELNALLDEVAATAARLGASGKAAAPLDFEKDDDDNFHIDFIAAAANLRAINYEIGTKDRMHVKLVAGKIIPAIATTTAAVTGLALIEFFKVLQDKDVSNLRNGMIDLGGNNYTLFDRDPPLQFRSKVESKYIAEKDYDYKTKIICEPSPHNKFSKIHLNVNASTTVEQLCDALLEKVNVGREEKDLPLYEVMTLGAGQGSLWNGMPSHSNTKKSILEVIEAQMVAEGNTRPDGKSYWTGKKVFTGLVVNLDLDDDDLNDYDEAGKPKVDELDIRIPTVMLHLE